MQTQHAQHTSVAADKPIGKVSTQEVLSRKKFAKEELLRSRGIKQKTRMPIVALVATGADLGVLNTLKEALTALPVVCLEIKNCTAEELLAADIALFATTDLAQSKLVETALAAAAIPVVSENIAPKLMAEDYDPISEQGNSFFASHENVWGLFAAVTRAVETFRFPYDWQGIVRNAIR